MNVLVIILISAVCLVGAYVLYGRWLANKWGIDPRAKTPAYTHEDGQDYVPTDGWTASPSPSIRPTPKISTMRCPWIIWKGRGCGGSACTSPT